MVEAYVDQASGTSEERTQDERMIAATKQRQRDAVLVALGKSLVQQVSEWLSKVTTPH